MVFRRSYELFSLLALVLVNYARAQDNCLQSFYANGTTTVYQLTADGDTVPVSTTVINTTPIFAPCGTDWTTFREIMTVVAADCSQTQIRDEPLLTSMGGPARTTCLTLVTFTPTPTGLIPTLPPPPITPRIPSIIPIPTLPLPPLTPATPLPPTLRVPDIPSINISSTTSSSSFPSLVPPPISSPTTDPSPTDVPPTLRVPDIPPREVAPPINTSSTTSPSSGFPSLVPPPISSPPWAVTPTLRLPDIPPRETCVPTTTTVYSSDCPPPATSISTQTVEIALATTTVTLTTFTFTVTLPAATVLSTVIDCDACATAPPLATSSPRWAYTTYNVPQ